MWSVEGRPEEGAVSEEKERTVDALENEATIDSIVDAVSLGGGLFIAATATSFRSFRVPIVRLSEILNSVNVAAPGSAYTCVYKTRL